MANDISGRPWICDTAGLVKAGRTHTTGFLFRNYTGGAASLATITDAVRGKIVATLPGRADNIPVGEAWYIDQDILNLTLALDSGQVEIIVR